jgi:hypothetical protein
VFMGHLGIALGAKGQRSEISLLVLCIAATLPDLIDFPLMGLGYSEGAGLWTHSVAALVCYGVAFGLGYLLITRDVTSSLVLGAVASSHVLVDFLTSRMVLWRGGPALGLHLYVSPIFDFILEGSVIGAGWWLYTMTLKKRSRFAAASIAILLILLAMQGWMETLHIS